MKVHGEEGVRLSLRHALLAPVSDGPKYGLQLRHEFEKWTGEVWPLNAGQVYTTLQLLERDGLIASDADAEAGPHKAYRITGDGASELDSWVRTPPDRNSPPRDELVIKVLVAIRMPDLDAHDVIQAHRRHIVDLMPERASVERDVGAEEISLALVVDAEQFRLDSAVRWLDAAKSRLRGSSSAAPR